MMKDQGMAAASTKDMPSGLRTAIRRSIRANGHIPPPLTIPITRSPGDRVG